LLTRRTKIATVALMSALSFPSAADAATVVDQVNIALAGEYGLAFGTTSPSTNPATSRIGTVQTVTAGLTGKLTAVDLQLWAAPGAADLLPFTISLYSGNYISGGAALIGSIAYGPSALPTKAQAYAGGTLNVDLSSLNFQVSSGSVFSVLMSVGNVTSGSAPRWALGTLADADGNLLGNGLQYGGGSAAYILGNGTILQVTTDRGFRSYVDVASVPEPASWAMMIGGFGVMGGTMRVRRRKGGVSFA
jgi:hypothetical protein